MTSSGGVLLTTDLPFPLRSRGKVRDVYEIGRDLLIVTTDRISAFDCILPTGIPGKGEVLNQMSLFWFEQLRGIVPNHLLVADAADYPAELRPYRDQLEGRSVLARRAEMFPVECVVRGYLAGSGWKDYQRTRTVCGIGLPEGLVESSELPEPVFTPASKAESGHDENISFEAVESMIGSDSARRVRELSLRIYEHARNYAASRGIIVADTKFEFGVIDGEIILADEVLTPDSSRFWPGDSYEPGRAQRSFDKQYVRDYLETLDWNKRPPAPVLPQQVVDRTSEKYKEAFRLLAGREL